MSGMKGVTEFGTAGMETDLKWENVKEAEEFYKKLWGLDREHSFADPEMDWTVEKAERSKSLGGLEYSTEYIKLYSLLSRCRSCRQWKKPVYHWVKRVQLYGKTVVKAQKIEKAEYKRARYMPTKKGMVYFAKKRIPLRIVTVFGTKVKIKKAKLFDLPASPCQKCYRMTPEEIEILDRVRAFELKYSWVEKVEKAPDHFEDQAILDLPDNCIEEQHEFDK